MNNFSFNLPAKKNIRVILADDHHVVRSGIRAEIERHPDIEVIGEASNGPEAISLVQQMQPDVLVLDINMPELSGVDVTAMISNSEMPATVRENHPWPPQILILSAYCEPEYVYNLFAAGAKGYLLKDEPPHKIVSGIRQIVRGEPALSLPVQKVLLTRQTKIDHELSSREMEVLRMMAKGHTNEEIAEGLVIAIGTVKNHVTNIYRKLPNVRTRSEAVAWAWEHKIVEVD